MSVRDGDEFVLVERHEADVLVFGDGVDVRACVVVDGEECFATFVDEAAGGERVLGCERDGVVGKRGDLRHLYLGSLGFS